MSSARLHLICFTEICVLPFVFINWTWNTTNLFAQIIKKINILKEKDESFPLKSHISPQNLSEKEFLDLSKSLNTVFSSTANIPSKKISCSGKQTCKWSREEEGCSDQWSGSVLINPQFQELAYTYKIGKKSGHSQCPENSSFLHANEMRMQFSLPSS